MKVTKNIGEHLKTLVSSGTFISITQCDPESAVLIVLCGKEHVYIVDVKTKVSGSKEDRVYNFEPHT